jgi:hypothetical protein
MIWKRRWLSWLQRLFDGNERSARLTRLGVAGAVALVLAFGNTARPLPSRAMVLPPPAATAEEAVELAVQSMGGTYAGVCPATRSPEDVGKTCARFVAEQGRVRAYLIGRTFSEYASWVFVQRSADGWHFLRVAPFGLTDSPTEVPWPCDCLSPNAGTSHEYGGTSH